MPTVSPANRPNRSSRRSRSALAVAVLLLAGCTDARDEAVPVPEGPPIGAESETGQVVHVTDGDTIVVRVGRVEERVRYIGIDAPEENAECLAEEASEANAELVDGAFVHLEMDVTDRDRYGRLLRHVWLNDGAGWTLASRELVRRGLAEAIVYPPDERYAAVLAEEQRDAQAGDRGIWGEC